MSYDYGRSAKKEQEALEAVVRMRKNLNDSKAKKGDFGFILVLGLSALISFQFRTELTKFAFHLHEAVTGAQTCVNDSVRGERAAVKGQKSQHDKASHKVRSAMKSGRHSHNA